MKTGSKVMKKIADVSMPGVPLEQIKRFSSDTRRFDRDKEFYAGPRLFSELSFGLACEPLTVETGNRFFGYYCLGRNS